MTGSSQSAGWMHTAERDGVKMSQVVEIEDLDSLGPRDYRAFMRAETPQLTLPTVQDQFGTWLRSKGIDFDSTNGAEFAAEGVRASVVEHTRGHDEYVRCRLIESSTPRVCSRTDARTPAALNSAPLVLSKSMPLLRNHVPNWSWTVGMVSWGVSVRMNAR